MYRSPITFSFVDQNLIYKVILLKVSVWVIIWFFNKKTKKCQKKCSMQLLWKKLMIEIYTCIMALRVSPKPHKCNVSNHRIAHTCMSFQPCFLSSYKKKQASLSTNPARQRRSVIHAWRKELTAYEHVHMCSFMTLHFGRISSNDMSSWRLYNTCRYS